MPYPFQGPSVYMEKNILFPSYFLTDYPLILKIHRQSQFKDPAADHQWLKNWVARLEKANGCRYGSQSLTTSLGKTHVWTINVEASHLPALVLFPGARTSVLFWDLNHNLASLKEQYRIFMVETNGLPNVSDGGSPDIRGLDYGYWGKEVMNQLGLESAYIAGASFGGLVCMKMGIAAPEKIKAIFLLNSGGLSTFSLSWTNLYYNLLPIFRTTEQNVRKFLDRLVFCAPTHDLPKVHMDLVVEYELFAITRYKDKTQKPYYLGKEMQQVQSDVYILEGDADLLFLHEKSIGNAKSHLPSLKQVKVFQNVGHGIETHTPAIQHMDEIIRGLS